MCRYEMLRKGRVIQISHDENMRKTCAIQIPLGKRDLYCTDPVNQVHVCPKV